MPTPNVTGFPDAMTDIEILQGRNLDALRRLVDRTMVTAARATRTKAHLLWKQAAALSPSDLYELEEDQETQPVLAEFYRAVARLRQVEMEELEAGKEVGRLRQELADLEDRAMAVRKKLSAAQA